MEPKKSETCLKLEREIDQVREELQGQGLLLQERNNDIEELRSKLGVREAENATLRSQIDQKASKLELAELNLIQIKSSLSQAEPTGSNVFNTAQDTEKDAEITKLRAKNEELVSRESELTAYIQQASHDREQIIQQYTAYCQQLAAQLESVSQQLQARSSQAESLTSREVELVAHVETLEAQMQSLRQELGSRERQQQQQQQQQPVKNDDHKELQILREKVAGLDKELTEVIGDRDFLQGRVHQVESEKASSNAQYRV